MRLRSVLRAVPGDDLTAALESDADAVLLSLTDETEPTPDLRRRVANAVQQVAAADKTPMVVVNHPRTQLARDDLDAIVSPQLRAVLLPHCTEPQDVRDIAVLLREFEYTRDIEPGDTALFPVIDTARGLLRATESIDAAPRTAGLVFASDAFARDVGARTEEKGARLAYARGVVVTAAAAYDTIALIEGSALELREKANYGFAGALLEDTQLVPIANDVFTPTPTAVKRARADLEAYEARPEGAWVARRAGTVVDAHRARQARQALERTPPSD